MTRPTDEQIMKMMQDLLEVYEEAVAIADQECADKVSVQIDALSWVMGGPSGLASLADCINEMDAREAAEQKASLN